LDKLPIPIVAEFFILNSSKNTKKSAITGFCLNSAVKEPTAH